MKSLALVAVAVACLPLPLAAQTSDDMRREIEAEYKRLQDADAQEKKRKADAEVQRAQQARLEADRAKLLASRKAKNPVKNSAWDGSVWQVESFMKHYLKDPKSFEAISWGPVVDMGSTYVVRLRYRARNSFGGYVIEDKTFTLDVSGNVVGVN
ncbi:hypothetical protein dqs_0601 [Azoarcus olearius]|uniref:hypothetical protein n=1 Tax=Azoarcus sp. (strain BH72) TaxID=418699 RepID=UPI000806183D|nr:hypothetical protein [Azoarcus olearius]ANQ83677.1 hypothetical protein dqs_0601 [Azoarcus olearius]